MNDAVEPTIRKGEQQSLNDDRVGRDDRDRRCSPITRQQHRYHSGGR
ncbi:MAG: hypothetical protein H0T75_10150 [Rhizobiales bacterium]|nr:hypothetical protein [Hyphomicrobiales bacterium]